MVFYLMKLPGNQLSFFAQPLLYSPDNHKGQKETSNYSLAQSKMCAGSDAQLNPSKTKKKIARTQFDSQK